MALKCSAALIRIVSCSVLNGLKIKVRVPSKLSEWDKETNILPV